MNVWDASGDLGRSLGIEYADLVQVNPDTEDVETFPQLWGGWVWLDVPSRSEVKLKLPKTSCRVNMRCMTNSLSFTGSFLCA